MHDHREGPGTGPAIEQRLGGRTSALLHALAHDGESARLSFSEILNSLGNRAFGLSMMVFALPCCLPMPPGIPTACGIALVSIGLHMIVGRERLWLPATIARRTVDRVDLQRLVDRALPHVRRVERFCRPRLAVATGRLGKAVIGLVVVGLGVVLILPIPLLGNLPPGIAAAITALGIAERDGVVVLVGLLAAAAAFAISGAATIAALRATLHLF